MAETYTMRGLDPQFWRKVKIHAAQKGVTVKQLICNLLAKAIGLVLIAVFCVGCDSGRQRDGNGALVPYAGEVATDNRNFTVGKLFTHDGYTVYRFYDGPTAVYYATPQAPAADKTASISTSWQTQRLVGVLGKGGHYVYDNHNVVTVGRP